MQNDVKLPTATNTNPQYDGLSPHGRMVTCRNAKREEEEAKINVNRTCKTTKQIFNRRPEQNHRTGAQGTCKHHRKTGNACKKML